MSKPLRTLIVEDSKFDAELIVQRLREGGYDPAFERVESRASMKGALEKQSWDLVISDYSMPQFDGKAALALFKEFQLDIPLIIVSGTLGEENAVEMMKGGAHDYVMKDNLARLAPAVGRELRAAQERRQRKRAEEAAAFLAAIVESSDDAIIGKTLEGIVLSWNQGAERIYGYTAEEMIGRSVSALIPASRPGELREMVEKLQRDQRVERYETARIRKDGKAIDVSITVSPIRNGADQIIGASTIARDITERRQQENERLKLIEELTEALSRVKTLSGLLPICAACKKIRDDQGYWQQVETYIRERSQAEFTHGICPDCFKRLYPEASLNEVSLNGQPPVASV